MPTLHLRLNANASNVHVSGGVPPQIDGMRLVKYSISGDAAINTLGVLVDMEWINVGLHNANMGGAHHLYLPNSYGATFTDSTMDITVESLPNFMPQQFVVRLYDHTGAAFAPGVNYEVNVWFEYTPVL